MVDAGVIVMAGFTAPKQYEPRAGWRQTLAEWAQSPPSDETSWQHQIGVYWRWRTVDGLWLKEAWEELGMEPLTAQEALDPDSRDSGRIPWELFGRLLIRSRGSTTPEDNITDVIITPTSEAELPDNTEVGYTPPELNPQGTALYQPRLTWKRKLRLNEPINSTGWFAQLNIYQRRRDEPQTMRQAWSRLNFQPIDARNALERNSADRGSIPPELIGRVVARSRLRPDRVDTRELDPDEEVKGIILYPEMSV